MVYFKRRKYTFDTKLNQRLTLNHLDFDQPLIETSREL